MISERFVSGDKSKAEFHLVKTQDCQKILDAMKELPDHMRYTGHTQHSQRMVGTVPNILAVSWAKEWGVRLYSKEWLEKTAKRLKTDPNWKALRAPQHHRY